MRTESGVFHTLTLEFTPVIGRRKEELLTLRYTKGT
jgi:hypothetical protein